LTPTAKMIPIVPRWDKNLENDIKCSIKVPKQLKEENTGLTIARGCTFRVRLDVTEQIKGTTQKPKVTQIACVDEIDDGTETGRKKPKLVFLSWVANFVNVNEISPCSERQLEVPAKHKYP